MINPQITPITQIGDKLATKRHKKHKGNISTLGLLMGLLCFFVAKLSYLCNLRNLWIISSDTADTSKSIYRPVLPVESSSRI